MSIVRDQIILNETQYRWRTWLLAWSGLIVMCSLYVTIPLNTLFASQFNVSASIAALSSSIFSICFACGCLLYGAIADKYGRKRVILLGMLGLALFTLAASLVHPFPMFIVLRALQGLTAATFSPVILAYIVSVFPAQHRVTAIGFVSTGFLLAGIVGQVVAGYIGTHDDWHDLFLMFGCLYSITALLLWRFLPGDAAGQPELNVYVYMKQIKHVILQKGLLLSYVVALVLLTSFIVMYAILNHQLQSVTYGLNEQSILWIRIAGIAGMICAPLAGIISQKRSSCFTLLLGLTTSMLSLIMMAVSVALPLLVLFSVCAVAGIAISVPALVSIVGQLGLQQRGIAVSLYTFVLFVGTAFAPFLSMHFISLQSGMLAFGSNALLLLPAILATLVIRLPK
ncbi:MFS transporter [Paenibacillus wenxiniae]|uniref:MFS transporter n=1 Tax=Paenibacillus wenxiniae TaxID=1636843 RepID=A0ABW4RHC9_9BACL